VNETLEQAIKAPNGKKSSTRIILLAWTMGVLLVFLIRNIFFDAGWDIPQGVIWLLGLLLGAKGVDNWRQTPASTPQPAVTEIPSEVVVS